jgi:hypothetical protein
VGCVSDVSQVNAVIIFRIEIPFLPPNKIKLYSNQIYTVMDESKVKLSVIKHCAMEIYGRVEV